MSAYETDTYEIFNEEQISRKTTKKTGKHRYFPSNKPQTFIRNALTGLKYPYIVGSCEQSCLYKMVDATGTCDADGYVIMSRDNLPNPNTNHLFYDSPEQCASHLHISIGETEITRWRMRTHTTLKL